MTPFRIVVLMLFATAAIYGGLYSYRSYERLQFYTHIEPDASLAESYEVELWLELPATIGSAVVSLLAAAPLFRRS